MSNEIREMGSFATVEYLEGGPGVDKYRALGMMSWLWMSSPLHRTWNADLQKTLLLPPVELGQYVIAHREGIPIAFCTWALLDKNAELGYLLDASTIPLASWNSGDRLWFVDWIAPFGARDSWTLKRYLARRFSHEVARAIRVKPPSTKARVMEFVGPGLERAAGRTRLNGYLSDTLNGLQVVARKAKERAAAQGQGTESDCH